MQEKIQVVKTLIDAFPFIKMFRDQIVVIKYGGAARVDPILKENFAKDITLMYLVGIKPVIVHGGGKKINDMLEKLGIETEFKDGQRVTSRENMEIVEMVLSGSINKEITSMLNHHGAKAIGISGKDANFIKARAKDREKFGYTGNITEVDEKVLLNLIDEKFIPVIAPIATGENVGDLGFNINADLVASKIAVALKAKKVIFMTDTTGVLDKDMSLISTLYRREIDILIADGTIQGGMIPKVGACLECINGGVEKAHIIDGRVEHSMLLELFTSDGIGTVVKRKDEK
ncbi:MAG TPA: acetylglutamate kinase [Campylobacterales bacterium]|nr:acetylglutamate kinase [Campylobacterales bacterium]